MSDPVRISDLTPLGETAFAPDDLGVFVDVSDASQAESGSTKSYPFSQLLAWLVDQFTVPGDQGQVLINNGGVIGAAANVTHDADGLHVGTPGGEETRIKPLEIIVKAFGGATIAFSANGFGPTLHGIGAKFFKTAFFDTELANTVGGGTSDIDWGQKNKQSLTLSANCTVTFSDPSGPASFILRVIQDGTGGRTITWPESILWPASTEPTLSTDPDAIDIISIYFDGTQYYGSYSLNFGVPA